MLFGPLTYENAPSGSSGAALLYRRKKWNRSKPVGREECPYESVKFHYVAHSALRLRFPAYSNYLTDQISGYIFGSDPRVYTLRNRCYSTLMGRIRGEHGGVQGLTFLAEFNESLRMVAARSMQFARAAADLRKGRFHSFLARWGLKPLPKHQDLKRTKAKEAAGLWLEYWFGWAPSLNDVYNAVNLLQQPIPAQRFKARARFNQPQQLVTSGARQEGVFEYGCSMRATVTVSNPNLWLANQLGLVNPASTAWELIPFSWLLGWWVNVGQVLSSLTDWFGLSVRDASTTYYAAAKGLVRASDPYWNQTSDYEGFAWVRSLGIHKPVLKVTGLSGLSVTRAATACSLVVQLFMSTNVGGKPRP
nr:MAG: maturation protein [Hangzhou fiers-like virus 4]